MKFFISLGIKALATLNSFERTVKAMVKNMTDVHVISYKDLLDLVRKNDLKSIKEALPVSGDDECLYVVDGIKIALSMLTNKTDIKIVEHLFRVARNNLDFNTVAQILFDTADEDPMLVTIPDKIIQRVLFNSPGNDIFTEIKNLNKEQLVWLLGFVHDLPNTHRDFSSIILEAILEKRLVPQRELALLVAVNLFEK